MPNILETEEMARKVLPIIYVIDTSGSMKGDKIASLNEAMHETVEVLKEVSNTNPDAQIKIAALTFSTGAEWVTNKNGLEDLDDFFWRDIQEGGVTDLGAAIDELNSKLSRNSFLVSDTGFCVPVIIFMSDGGPTDSWKNKLKNIFETNKWYKGATKIAIAVGDDADKDVLAKVVGNIEAVISVTDVALLKKLIKVASVTSSMISSKSRTTANSDTATEIIKTAVKELGNDAQDIQIGSDDTSSSSDTSNNNNNPSDSGWDDNDW